jgi:hypothetical protein
MAIKGLLDPAGNTLIDPEGNELVWGRSSPGGVCLGQHSVCLMRVANLAPDCSPAVGAGQSAVMAGIITATARPVFNEEQEYEAVDPSGLTAWRFLSKKQIVGYEITGELTYFDHQGMGLLLGGVQIIGAPGTPFEGSVIGWGSPWETDTVVTPPKFEFDAATLKFSAKVVANPNLGPGPWGDWPGTGSVPNSAYTQVSYSQDEYNALVASAGCGLAQAPTQLTGNNDLLLTGNDSELLTA